MSDFIPTTAEVRDAYSSESTDSKFANRAFDLWLAKYKAKIIAQTEERIIKLLEKYEAGGSDPDTYDHIPHEQLIALIKGEQK